MPVLACVCLLTLSFSIVCSRLTTVACMQCNNFQLHYLPKIATTGMLLMREFLKYHKRKERGDSKHMQKRGKHCYSKLNLSGCNHYITAYELLCCSMAPIANPAVIYAPIPMLYPIPPSTSTSGTRWGFD